MIVSHITLLFPYGLSALSLVLSGIGTTGGVPYTVADDEYTRRVHACASIACSKYSVADTLLW